MCPFPSYGDQEWDISLQERSSLWWWCHYRLTSSTYVTTPVQLNDQTSIRMKKQKHSQPSARHQSNNNNNSRVHPPACIWCLITQWMITLLGELTQVFRHVQTTARTASSHVIIATSSPPIGVVVYRSVLFIAEIFLPSANVVCYSCEWRGMICQPFAFHLFPEKVVGSGRRVCIFTANQVELGNRWIHQSTIIRNRCIIHLFPILKNL